MDTLQKICLTEPDGNLGRQALTYWTAGVGEASRSNASTNTHKPHTLNPKARKRQSGFTLTVRTSQD